MGATWKGDLGGQTLVAIARDSNDNIFPIAFAVVEQENKDSWVWFLQLFSNDIGNLEQLNPVFITNRQKVWTTIVLTYLTYIFKV